MNRQEIKGPEMDKDTRLGVVFNIKCYHPKEDKEYQCEAITGTDPEYQGWQCPKCKHEIMMEVKQYYLNQKELDKEDKP